MTPTLTEADTLRQRIAEAEQQHAEAVRAWHKAAMDALPQFVFENRMRSNLFTWDTISEHDRDWYREHVRKWLDALGPEPVEPIRLDEYRARLARLEGGR